MQEIEFSNGQIVKVRAVPFALVDAVRRHNPVVSADPMERAQEDAKQDRAMEMATIAHAFMLDDDANVKVPEGWSFPVGLRLSGVEPRDHDVGRRVDYVLYSLMADADDYVKVQGVMWSKSDEVGKAAERAAETFQDTD